MKKRSEKQQDLDNLKTDLAKVSTVILSTFQGITVEEDNKLRRAVEQAGGKYRVVKNTLAESADENRQGRSGIQVPRGDRRRARTFDRGDSATRVAAVEGRIAQQNYVSARRAGHANRVGSGGRQPQPGHYGQ